MGDDSCIGRHLAEAPQPALVAGPPHSPEHSAVAQTQSWSTSNQRAAIAQWFHKAMT